MASHHIPLLSSRLLLLLVSLFVIGASVFGDVNIDCGASDSHTDENNIEWIGDATYIRNGDSRVVQGANSVSVALSTLRVFSTRKKNCYPISVTGGGKILVRVSFYYGNYDQKSSPPSFALQFDGNSWETVVTSMDQVVYYEVVYTVNGDGTNVCVAQTKPDQLPFVSAIEVRSLDSEMYRHVDSSFALFTRRRVAFGAPSTVRYPDDVYDRIWAPSVVPAGLTVLQSDSTVMDATNLKDNPPIPALQNAIRPTNASNYITLGTNLPAIAVPIYINMYFAEMTQLSSTDNRTFAIFVDGKQNSDPISPPYQSVDEYYFTNETATGSTEFALKATPGSTLPPIISAMEVFSVSDPLSNGTDANDVQALGMLQVQFDVLQDWTGDPCLPASYNWDWVGCSSDETPRITALNLGGYGLAGVLPDFSSMDALQTIDLHNNNFSGGIPDFLGSLPILKELNLANNSFSGPIPPSLSSNQKIKLDISGNPNLCASGDSCETTTTSTSPATTKSSSTSGQKKKSGNLGLILGLTIPLSFVAIVVFGAVLFLRSRRGTAPVAAVNQGQTTSPRRPGGPSKKPGVSTGAQDSTSFTCSWKSVLEVICIGYNCYRLLNSCLSDEEKRAANDGDNEEEDIEKQMPPEPDNNGEEEECAADVATSNGTRSESRVPPTMPRIPPGGPAASSGNRRVSTGKPGTTSSRPRGAASQPRNPSSVPRRGPTKNERAQNEKPTANEEDEDNKEQNGAGDEEEEGVENEETNNELESGSYPAIEEEETREEDNAHAA